MNAAGVMAGLMRQALLAACGMVLATMLALVGVTVFQRYVFAGGFLGAEEASIWLLLLLACAGFPLAASGPAAMRVNLLPQATGSIRDFTTIVAETFILLACFALVSAGMKAAPQLGGVSPLLGLGEWLRPSMLAGAGMLGVILRILECFGEGNGRTFLGAIILAVMVFAFMAAGPEVTVLRPSVAAASVAALGIAMGAPLPHVFIVSGYVAIAFGSPLVEPAFALNLLGGMGRYLLLAIPFFLLAGGFLTVSRMGANLVAFANHLVGGARGGLGQTVLLASVLFSGTSGSSIANAAFSAKTFFPSLLRNGYSPERAGAVIAATAVLDNIIPPSIAFLILATATNLPVGPLLTGGLVGGLILALTLAATIRFVAKSDPVSPSHASEDGWRLAVRALPVFGLGLVVLFGIRFGIVTPTEAAAIAAVYTLVAALAAKSAGRDLVAAFCQAGREAAAIVVLIGAASPLAFLLATDGVTAWIADLAASFGSSPLGVLLAMNMLLLIVGLVLDIGAAILLFAPILMPAAIAVGIDPVHFGVLVVVNLMIGGLTPPVGILVQVVSATTAVPAVQLFRAVLPYLAGLIAALVAMSIAVAAMASFL